MNPAAFALRKSTCMYILVFLLVVAGGIAYWNMGRLEDPNFTIKTALVVTPYPGATPSEVEQEVTDVVEEAIQAMGQVKKIYSISQEGVSLVYVDMKDSYDGEALQQVWDELRRKVNDAAKRLPPGAGPSVVNDDFSDVYGVFFALTGEGYSPSQLREYARELKRELLLCRDVAKIDLWGTLQDVVYVEFKRARMAEMGLSPDAIRRTLASQNLVEDSGNVNVGEKYLRVTPTGDFVSENAIADLLVGGAQGLVRLGDVATISRGYTEPPARLMRFNGHPAVGIGISTVDGGNVVTMGQDVSRRIAELEPVRPLGMELTPMYYQSDIVTESVNAFVINLVESVGIVIGLLMLFMGRRSGLLIGFVLILNILMTFIGMYLMHIDLQKVSLGALILALGMLVDNAIVVADGFLIGVSRGLDRKQVASDVVRDTQWPLLGATAVAILAFAAIGYAPGQVGEFTRSLFHVMALSLSCSWILAVVITPLLCVDFLHAPATPENGDPYGSPMYAAYRNVVHTCLKHKGIVVAVSLALLCVSAFGFTRVPQNLFPPSTQRYFYVSTWRPQGTRIEHTSASLETLERHIMEMTGVKNVSSFVGEGTLRFILNYNYETPNSSYGQLLVEVEDYHLIDETIYAVEKYVRDTLPDMQVNCARIITGPSKEYTVEARFRGPDTERLKELGEMGMAVLKKNPNARDIRTDWRHEQRVFRPVFAENAAQRVGVTRQDLSRALQFNFNGATVGLFREGETLIPIVARPVPEERASAENLEDVQVWSAAAGRYLPVLQVISDVDIRWEDPLVRRYNRQKAVTVQCNPVTGLADTLRREVKGDMEAIPLPTGYSLEWEGEFADSEEAVAPLKWSFPLCMVGMFLLVLFLFNSVKRTAVVFLTVPLSLIGVTAAFLLTGQPFGFMAILGFLGLSGMLIKNAIVLIDQIELELKDGKDPYLAVLDSSVSRLRPVTMAAGTTILGMTPLMTDPFFSAMAATIMGGLFVGTFLTLLLVPALYCLFFGISAEAGDGTH
jgi:multidrug efflux pump subunit AcrB